MEELSGETGIVVSGAGKTLKIGKTDGEENQGCSC